MERKKGELLISERKEYQSLDNLFKTRKKNCPTTIIFNTNDVLSKILKTKSKNNPKALVEKAFPNFNFENFYYELVSFGEHTVISIIKKDKVNELLKELIAKKISVVNISLGVCSLVNIKNHIERDIVRTSNTELLFDSATINSITRFEHNEPVHYEINGLEIENDFLLGFSGILSFISKGGIGFSNLTELNEYYKSEFQNKRFFDVVSKLSLGLVLTILLLNFFFFNHYFQKVGELRTLTEINGINKKNLSELTERVVEKQKRLDAILSSGNSKSSYYLDGIGKSVPTSVLIHQIQYQPLLKPLRNSKPVEVEENIIIIEGNSFNTNEFSIWIEQLETKSWIRKVETLDFDYQNKDNSLFSIKIVLDDEQ
ncbi:hypothetical protein [Costertonia aggregata]|uniref:PilN domain-containing protein n=1 Tax=Costertonia aggregata TaxID=343403 RepID=A0A7H9ATJ8_9FLAO|nr:hypothetical protein [Costertonia aggregata]QLG46770.1 hypothetical protein HYG79_15895 [Costertonia aggregata]